VKKKQKQAKKEDSFFVQKVLAYPCCQ